MPAFDRQRLRLRGCFRRGRGFRRFFHGFSRCIQAVHRVNDRLRCNRRACHRVNAFAQRQRCALADELRRERFLRALLTQTRRLRGRIHRQGRNHAIVVRHADRDVVAIVARSRRRLDFRSLRSGVFRAAGARNRRGLRVFQHHGRFRRSRCFRRHRFEILRRHRGRSQRRVDGLHRCRRGDGRAGQPVHIFIQGKRAALADELRRELFVRAARAEAGRAWTRR